MSEQKQQIIENQLSTIQDLGKEIETLRDYNGKLEMALADNRGHLKEVNRTYKSEMQRIEYAEDMGELLFMLFSRCPRLKLGYGGSGPVRFLIQDHWKDNATIIGIGDSPLDSMIDAAKKYRLNYGKDYMFGDSPEEGPHYGPKAEPQF